MNEGFIRKTLENGLLVSLKEIRTAPIASAWMWYRVGSRNEIPGITGASHWVEHMQFKGTAAYPNGVLDRAISRLGGYWNAMTHLDWTTYFSTMPAEHIDLILKLEADRLHGSLFTEEHVASERTVIISERQGHENNPGFLLGEAVQAAAFRVHSYHHHVIGDMTDLERLTREDLYYHYQTHYQPGNAVLAVAGAFEPESMLEKIEELFGRIPGHELPVFSGREEPLRVGEYRIEMEGPGDSTFIDLVYPAPRGADEDFFPYLVLDSLLTGASNLNLFGGGISNKTSRLYQALVEREIAVSVSGGIQVTIDPFLYQISITIHPGRKVSEAVQALEEEVERLKSEPPPDTELERAVKQARALFAYGSESISFQAFWLGFAEMFDTYDWFETYLDRLAAVTPEDVQRVAQEYLVRQQRVLGVFRPYDREAAHG
ncbi:MAG: insulinase family protein [Anaerolineales bacterium]|nr:insulinase family protein [Anaerolineales bacterium]